MSDPRTGDAPAPALSRFLAGLLPILLAGLALRLLGLRAGLPYLWHPDEPILMNEVVEMLQEDRLDPQFYHYPSLPFYLHMLGTAVWYLRQAGHPGMVQLDAIRTEADTGIFRTISNPDLWAHERGVTVLVGLLAVALTGLAGRRLWGDRVGWLAALLLALSPHHIGLSRFVTVDVPTSAGVAAVLLASAFLLREGATRHCVFAGAMLGVSVACKYTVVVGAVVPLAALLLRRPARLWPSLGLWPVAGIALLACQPWFALKPSAVLTDMATEVNRYATLDLPDRFSPDGRLDYLWRCLEVLGTQAFPGWLLLAIPACWLVLRREAGDQTAGQAWQGAGQALRPDIGALILTLAMPVTFLLFMSGNKVFYDRNLTTVEPALAVLCAVGAARLWEVAAGAQARAIRAVRPLLAVGLAALALYSGALSVDREREEDSRSRMVAWLKAEGPPGMKLAVPVELRMEDLDGLDTVRVRIHQPQAWARTGATHVLGSPNLGITGLNKAGWTKEMGERGRDWFRAHRPLHTEGQNGWTLDGFSIHPRVGLYALDAAPVQEEPGGDADADTGEADPASDTSDAAEKTAPLPAEKPAPLPAGWTLLPLSASGQAAVTDDAAEIRAGPAAVLLCAPRETGPIRLPVRAVGLTGGRATVRLVDADNRTVPGGVVAVIRLKGDQQAELLWPGPLPEGAAGVRVCIEAQPGEGTVRLELSGE